MKERRRYERFSLELPAKLEIVTQGEDTQTFDLSTSDISAGGAFFPTKHPFPQGTNIQIRLTVVSDRLRQLTRAEGYVEVGGTVVRSEPAGMAVCFDETYQFASLGNN
ncbi:MAG: PilZ domain-containing protein [Deltaproteobacteria bacterium]|nr:MAG: PilZ domain-containing protein [Deltaproteobacteria bacterium]